jgi:hypothetical protein
VLQVPAAPLINCGASAKKALIGGFYQSAVMIMRDILKTMFRFEFFHSRRYPTAV